MAQPGRTGGLGAGLGGLHRRDPPGDRRDSARLAAGTVRAARDRGPEARSLRRRRAVRRQRLTGRATDPGPGRVGTKGDGRRARMAGTTRPEEVPVNSIDPVRARAIVSPHTRDAPPVLLAARPAPTPREEGALMISMTPAWAPADLLGLGGLDVRPVPGPALCG